MTTIAQLIDRLSAFDPNLIVYTEGCDCMDLAGGVSEYAGGIVIEREDRPRHHIKERT